jgi:hypothetical protein
VSRFKKLAADKIAKNISGFNRTFVNSNYQGAKGFFCTAK